MNKNPHSDLDQLQNDIDKLQQNILEHAREEEIAAKLSDYYDAAGDIENTSQFLHQLTIDLDKIEGHDRTQAPIVAPESLSNHIGSAWYWVEKNILGSIIKLRGVPAWLGSKFMASFSALRDELKQLGTKAQTIAPTIKEKIIGAFGNLCKFFKRMINGVIEKLFDLLAHIGNIAHSKGFKISKTEVKLPTMKFSSFVFGAPVPIPSIEMPEITITIE